MKMRMVIELLWLALAVTCAVGAFRGGDTSILCGWAFLVLTFPFWLAWQNYAYDPVLSALSKDVTDVLGVSLSIAAALLVWWHIVPVLLKKARTHSEQRENG